MKPVASRLTFPLLCLAVGLVVFGVSYTLLGQGPEGNVGDRPPGSTPDPTPGGPGAGEGEPGPVGQVNELFAAIVERDANEVLRALSEGENPNQTNEEGESALHWALMGAGFPTMYGVVQVLLDHGAMPNARNRIGLTPMHYAAQFGASEAMVSALIRAGGDPLTHVENYMFKTPYEAALVLGHEGAVAAIERKTAYRPANYDVLQALGFYNKAIRAGIAAGKSKAETFKQAAEKLRATNLFTEEELEALANPENCSTCSQKGGIE